MLKINDVDRGGWSLMGAAMTLYLADYNEIALEVLGTVVERAQSTGEAWTFCLATSVRAIVHHWTGDLAEALAEYAQANVDLIKEHTPTLDGGESLVQQADILAATGPALRECHEAFEVLHEDRLKRQRDPEHGEEHWDVAAAQE